MPPPRRSPPVGATLVGAWWTSAGTSLSFSLDTVYEGRCWEASMRRHREALVVSMVGMPIGAVHGNFFSVVVFFNQGYHSNFIIIEIIF